MPCGEHSLHSAFAEVGIRHRSGGAQNPPAVFQALMLGQSNAETVSRLAREATLVCPSGTTSFRVLSSFGFILFSIQLPSESPSVSTSSPVPVHEHRHRLYCQRLKTTSFIRSCPRSAVSNRSPSISSCDLPPGATDGIRLTASLRERAFALLAAPKPPRPLIASR